MEPQAVHWGVVEGKKCDPILITHDRMSAPKIYNEAEALTWYRERVLLLLTEYQPTSAAIRYPEPTARGGGRDSSRIRVRIEGVVLEAINSQGLKKVVTGSLKTISANIGSKAGKKYLSSEDLRGLDWSELHQYRKEAILAATAALED